MELFFQALTLQLGYNTKMVMLGCMLLGGAAGAVGTFLFLRKQILISDALSHATLPGVTIAFLMMVALGGDGRNLAGILLGAALSAFCGGFCVSWMTRTTRLHEDAAMGAVLSVSFGLGIVLLTVIQAMNRGRPAGLESFLLGSTAGLILQDVFLIASGSCLIILLILLWRRPLTVVAFDPEYATTLGIFPRENDLRLLVLVLSVVVFGLKMVGLILSVALLVLPPVTARFWTNKTEVLLGISMVVGASAGYGGAALSAVAPRLPTGPVVVLVAFSIFLFSLLFAPACGILASLLRRRHFQIRVHLRQGLLALAHQEPILDSLTLRVLRNAGMIRADHVPTAFGRRAAAKILRDEALWSYARKMDKTGAVFGRYDGITPIEEVLTKDQIAALDAALPTPTLLEPLSK